MYLLKPTHTWFTSVHNIDVTVSLVRILEQPTALNGIGSITAVRNMYKYLFGITEMAFIRGLLFIVNAAVWRLIGCDVINWSQRSSISLQNILQERDFFFFTIIEKKTQKKKRKEKVKRVKDVCNVCPCKYANHITHCYHLLSLCLKFPVLLNLSINIQISKLKTESFTHKVKLYLFTITWPVCSGNLISFTFFTCVRTGVPLESLKNK